MKNDILEAIAINSTFGIDEVHRVYEIFKSYDLLVSACEFAQKTGHANLETACILVKSSKQSTQTDDVFYYHIWLGFWFRVSYKIYLWAERGGWFGTMASCSRRS